MAGLGETPRQRQKNATPGGKAADPGAAFRAGTAPGMQEQPAHEPLSSRATLEAVPLAALSFELSPVGRRNTGGRDGRWFKRFAEVGEDLTSRGLSHPGLRPLANLPLRGSRLLPAVCSESDVAAAVRALERKLLPHPGQESRSSGQGGRAQYLVLLQ